MAGRKPAAVGVEDLKRMKLSDVVALHTRVREGAASPADAELLPRVVSFLRGRYQRGALSEKVARQLGIA